MSVVKGEDTPVVADWAPESGPIGMIVVELATAGTGGGGGGGSGGSSGLVDVTVGSSGDDVYVSSSGSFSSTSGNLWFGRWNNGTAVVEESMYARFSGVSVPVGATITDAYVTFTLDNNYASSDMLATVKLQDVDDAVAPVSNAGFQAAARTSVVAVWLMQSSWSGDPVVQSGDLSVLVQEVVDRPGWVSGSALGVFVEDPTSGSGTNDWGFWSYDKDPAKAPRLVVEYTVGGGTGGGTGGGGAVLSDSVYIGGVYESTVTDTTTSETLYYSLNGIVASRTDGTVEWVLSDQLGSPNTIINAATGATTRRLHDPFGTVRFDDGVDADRSFTGQIGDPSTGLLFYNARYYDPLIGRFVSPDTIVPDPSNPQDLNRYSYVRNNPATFTDPTGNWPFNGCGNMPLFGAVCNFVSQPTTAPIAEPLVEGIGAVAWGASELAGYTDIGDGWTLLSGRDTHGDPVGGVERGLAAGGVFIPWFSGKLAKTLLKYADTALLNSARRASSAISPSSIRFSQSSVNNVDEIAASMRANGWVGDPIDIVRMPDGSLAALDNTRVLAANQAGIDVQATVRAFDAPLSADMAARFATPKGGVPSTWGEAIANRIGNQNAPFRSSWPDGSPFTGWDGN